MTSIPVFNTLSNLGSSKTRERNAALDELTSVLKQSPDLIPTKTLASTCETLIELLDSECRKYCLLVASDDANASKLSLTENRLSLVAYVLRLFIEKTCGRFKVKTMKLLLTVLPELMVAEGSNTLIEPISVHLTFALHALIKSKLFQLKMVLHQWISLVNVVCSYLDQRLEVSLTDRNISNLISILNSLLSVDCVGLTQVREAIYRTLMKYLRRNEKVNSNTRLVLSIINDLIIKTHCLNILDALRLVKETWKHVIAINVSTNEDIQDELCYLDILASELIVHNIPTMIGSEGAAAECSGNSLHGICREYLLTRLTGCKASWFSTDSLEFSNDYGTEESFLELGDFRLKEGADAKPGLSILSITRLSISYFKLLQRETFGEGLFKRHKCEPSLSSILRNSQSMLSFLLNGLQASDADIQLVCLQMAAFTAALQDLDANDILDLKSAIEQKFENVNLIKWACVALTPLFTQSNLAQIEIENSLNRILKLCLPLIKQPELCSVACTLLSCVMKHSSFIVPDKATLSQISSVYELSDVNGPGLLCNEAFQFWQYLQNYGKHIDSFSLEFISRKIVTWVETKWQHIILLQSNQHLFYEFIAWLCNRKPTGPRDCVTKSSSTLYHQNMWQNRYTIWTSQMEERFFMLQIEPERKTFKLCSPQTHFNSITTEKVNLNEILYRLLELIEGENGLTSIAKFNWICQVSSLVEYLSGDLRYANYVLDFKKGSSTVLNSIKLQDKEAFAIFFRSILRLEAPTIAHFVFEQLPIEKILADFKQLLLQGIDNRHPEAMKFDVPFERDVLSNQAAADNFTTNPSVESLVSLSLRAFLKVLQHKPAISFGDILECLMGFLNGLKTDDFISCIDPVINWIGNQKESSVSVTHQLQVFTEILSEYLLQSDYNTSSVAAFCLCSFLESVSTVWLENSDNPLNADCSDIFDWVIARFEDTFVSGRLAIKRLSQLLLHMLKSHDLSRGHIKGGKQRVFAAYSKTLKALNAVDMVSQLSSMMDYMIRVSSKNQHILFSEICSLVEIPQQSIEMSALYSLAMWKISTASYLNMSLAMRDLMQYSHFEHTRVYVASALKKMALTAGLNDTTQLFDVFRFDILSLWFDESFWRGQSIEDVWDIRIFGFMDLSQFVELYAAELSALYFSRRQKPTILEQLTNITGCNEKQLLTKYYYLVFPLSFIEGGMNEDIHDFFHNLTGEPLLTTKNRTLTFRWILRFVDLGSNYETSTIIGKSSDCRSRLQLLYSSHPNVMRYQHSIHIPLDVGGRLLHQLVQKSPLCKDEINFILLSILSDLEKSFNYSEKLKYLREMKLTLAINDSGLSACDFLPTFLPPLCKCLASLELHNETADIIVFILTICREHDFTVGEEFIPLFCELFLFKRRFKGELSNSLKEVLNWLAESASVLKTTVKYCNDAIQGKLLSLDVYSKVEILSHTNCGVDKIVLLSLLLGHAQRPSHTLNIEKPSIRSVQNLLKHEIASDFITENFQLWTAYYLKAFTSEQDLKTVMLDPASLSGENYEQLFDKFGSLECVLKEFLTIAKMPPNLASCAVRLFCASMVGLFLTGGPYGDEKAILVNNGGYTRCNLHCWFVTDSDFWSINNEVGLLSDMNTFITDSYLHRTISYAEWLAKFNTALILHLTPSIPKLKLFHPLCRTSSFFAQKILPILFRLAICFDHPTSTNWITALFSQVGGLVVCFEAKQKVNSLLSIMNMLMTGRKLKDSLCTSCCTILPLKAIYEAALKTDQITSAYMIFEMLYMGDLSNLDHDGLRLIYEALGEVDLLAGLPAPQTLIEALDSATKIEPTAWKTFLYSNAMVDAQLWNTGKSEKLNLLKTTECQGLYGVAARLSTTLLPFEETLCEYRWALQLGNWDLPVPKVIDSKEKGLYFALRSVSSGVQSPSRILDDAMVELVRNRSSFEERLEWAETIAEIALLKQMTEDFKSSEGMMGFIHNSFALDKRALHSYDFRDYKSNIQARFLLSQLLMDREFSASSLSAHNVKICSAALLVNNVQLSIQEKCSQDALRNAILFGRFFQPENTSSVYRILGSYVSAKALWESGDSKTPVTLLKALLEEHPEDSGSGPLGPLLAVSKDEIRALLVNWTSKSRLETASAIFEKYIKDFETTVKDHEVRADTFYVLANFLHTQVKKMKDSGQIEERQKRCERGTQESRALEVIHKKTNLSSNERKDARRHYNRVLLQLNSDREILNSLLVQRVQFVWRSLHYFINTLVFTNKYDGDVLDKFCGLWFEHDGDDSINSLLKKEIGMIPSWKFLPWVNQIASKLSIEDKEFQKPLQLTMKRVLYKLPYESLYPVLSMKLYENHSFTSDSIIPQKIKAVDKILSELQAYDNGSYYRSYVLPLKEFCEMSVELANFQLSVSPKGTKKIHLQNLKIGSYWLKTLPNLKLPLPTSKWQIKSSSDGKVPRPYIVSVGEMVDISVTGLSLPKIVTFTISDGSRHKVLMKGSNDDLRQDAIMEKVFQQVNSILQREKRMRKLNLTISTYTVIPLGPRAGIIEFVTNSLSLHQVLTALHAKDKVSFNEARNEMKKVQTKSNSERLRIYIKLTEEIKPQLRHFFFDSFPDPDQWFEAKKTYTKGIATTSIVGYILGLGDRHLNNILLDHETGKPTHIDLGIAFDQGRLLPIPEMVPFRLTRDIVDGFGVTGVEGLYRRSCEHTYSVLRDNYEKVMHVLNILKWDPLYSWVMSPVKKHKHLLEEESQEYSSLSFDSESSNSKVKGEEQNQESYRALKGVEEKLIGNGLSVEATVQELIQQASDPQNLSLVYMGWSPFY
ncbi:hypothetical protein HG536_0B04440 [Torulaspora globosa]|uniref:Serine/threonine-protein kinase Tel1 n=1 Tax=Torulaspora globosa TaxID=48254 RepID=A0A7G3ZDJ4_9SACH|nr:uncharacterized protein HG536_0B04440 [Torulaspora globosa]QLL31580.1 hypothetical protein HG536_0B04440 [Torulaspora globosa]